jgi:hypothetical protein
MEIPAHLQEGVVHNIGLKILPDAKECIDVVAVAGNT